MQNLGRAFLKRAQEQLARLGLATPAAHLAERALGAGSWELGELRGMSILEPDAAAAQFRRFGCVTLLDFAERGIRLWISATGDQIYLVGGRQNLRLGSLGIEGGPAGPVLIGPVEHLRYVSARSGERVEYEHVLGYDFGSDYSELPVLVYDPAERRLALVGGVYRVGRSMGIVN